MPHPGPPKGKRTNCGMAPLTRGLAAVKRAALGAGTALAKSRLG
ncbi:MAG: hypothetical protein ACREFJ_20335 [Acetobacteraceae bacterium]